jgi:Leucine-rich repeat (LRR) protein
MLELLDLRKNNINILKSNIFEGLISLKKLDCSKNRIALIEDHCFVDLSKLEDLNLSFNFCNFSSFYFTNTVYVKII